MAETQVSAGISVKPYYGTAKPIEGMATPQPQRLISFTLEPTVAAEKIPAVTTLPEYANYEAPVLAAVSVPKLPILTKKPVIFDIETTGFDPKKDRLVCIGAKDPTEEDESFEFFANKENEAEAIKEFMEYVKNGGYNEVVGINPGFDMQFLLWKCMRYGIPSREFFTADPTDLQDIIKRGTEKYLYYSGKATKLNDMLRAMFNKEPPMEDTQALEEVAKGNDEPFYKIVAHHVIGTTKLYRMWKFTADTSFGSYPTVGLEKVGESTRVGGAAQCEVCLAGVKIEQGQKTFVCPVCGWENILP